jgi:hypothetical protein
LARSAPLSQSGRRSFLAEENRVSAVLRCSIVRTAFSSDGREDRILGEAAARLSLHRFEQERDVRLEAALADRFVSGYRDGFEGAALERAVGHQRTRLHGEELAAFAFGWCRGNADLRGHCPTYRRVEQWLSRRVRS